MNANNLRSLLVAAIILSNCIAWTASRHHFTHNVHGHHSRHRRQGAGLYLPTSFVIPTKLGETETQGWGEWGEVSPCSRTCGGGVASQKRICLKIGQDGSPLCRGGDTKYFSCGTQDCPDGSIDFRAQQCAEFNDQDFRGFKYNWVPYTRSINPCELNCMPRGERFYYRHKPKVIDGTRCNDDSFDVCVDGTCQSVGCDMMLGSTAREDKCRKCRGNGTNCHTNMGLIDTQDLMAGYNDIILIPEGATTIVIEERRPSSNYLALRNKNGTFYLNGYYHIDFPRNMMIAGALWTYESSHIGIAAPDKLKCLGPIDEPLYLSLLRQEDNVGILYEYSLPKDKVTPTDKRYTWGHDDFTPCSVSCGGGIQTRNVTCRTNDDDLEIVDDNLCDEGLKPATNQTCGNEACPAYWSEGKWGECSKRCGPDGRRTREVNCQKIIAKRFPSLVADQECLDLHGPKPRLSEECNVNATCPNWFVGRWKPCDKLCDEGKQTRQVICYQKTNGRVEVLDDEECEVEKPETEIPCLLAVCEGVDWVTSPWFGCDTCVSKVRTRQVKCASENTNTVYNDSLCAKHPKPSTEELCDKDKLPKCLVSWYATQWSKCSVQCGVGEQYRNVFCGVFDGTSVFVVADAECASQPKYNDTQSCTVPEQECPALWFLGPWSNCSNDCRGGVQYSATLCFKDDQNSTDCPDALLPDTTQLCNQTCDADLPECDEAEDVYKEEGLDAESLSTVDDTMFSDSTYTESDTTFDSSLTTDTGSGLGSFAELESTLSTDSGSGFGSSIADDELILLSTKRATDKSITVDIDYTTGGSGDTEISSSTDITSSDYTDSTEITGGSPITGETGSTDSSSDESSITDASSTSGVTNSTESTITDKSSTSEEAGSTESGSLTSVGTGSTASPITDGSPISSKTDSSVSTNTETTSKETISTESSITDISLKSEGTESDITETVIKEITASGGTGSTESSSNDVSSPSGETSSTGYPTAGGSSLSEKTDFTELTTPDTASVDTGSTESIATDGSPPSSERSSTESFTMDGSPLSEKTDSTESTITDIVSKDTESVVSDVSSSSGETVSITTVVTDGSSPSSEASSTEPTITDIASKDTESVATDGSSPSSESDSTESVVTDESLPSVQTSSTVSSITDGSSLSEETGSTESTITDTVSKDASSTESTITDVSLTSKEPDSTESITTDLSSKSEVPDTTEAVTTEETLTSAATSSKQTTTIDNSSTSEGSTEAGVTDEILTPIGSSSTEPSITDGSSTSEEAGSTESTAIPSSSVSIKTDSAEATTLDLSSKSEEPSSVKSITTDETSITEEASPAVTTMRADDSETTSTPEPRSTSEIASTEGITVTETQTKVSDDSSTTEVSASSGKSAAEESKTPSTITSNESSDTTIVDSSTTSSAESSEFTTNLKTESTIEVAGRSSTSDAESIETSASSTISVPDATIVVGSEITTTSEPEITTTSEPKITTTTEPESTSITDVKSTSSSGAETTTISQSELTTISESIATTTSGSESTTAAEPEITTIAESITTTTTGPELTTTSEQELFTESSLPVTDSRLLSSTEITEVSTTTEIDLNASTGFETTTISSGLTTETSESVSLIFTSQKPGKCRPRIRNCLKSKFGCCPDGRKPAEGPFELGCHTSRTCQESPYRCCPDGVSPAQGDNYEGCPPATPCEETLFGCCNSDNETPAEGNDQEGCPPPPPACKSSIYGCCADEETEATGPDSEGCPESTTEPTTTEFPTTTEVFTDCSTDTESTTVTATETESETTTEPITSEGSTTLIVSTTIEEGCDGSEFGCCYDNETEASGPNGQGCPCNATEFGCCPDGVSPAQGENNLGCQGVCRNSPHGCCQDNETPAHGPDFEGCCAGTAFGCCPDNREPAKGPHLEGCGCQHYLHGCCPDNATVAQGPNKEGCGCQYTEFGCCPDRHTTASGPNFKGCGCHTFQFGCCPDGVTVAKEPQKQDCSCRYSTYGCCGDGQTPALGDNSTGCDCSASKYGCCPDGVSEAMGSKFLGCTDIPFSKQAVCSHPKDTGSCTKYRAMWYYDLSYGGCSYFWYGGCEGNGNRFDSQAECEDVCVHPDPKDACNLPEVRGPCDNDLIRWYYNSSVEQCIAFRYGGCLGNDNNFDSRELCQKHCEVDRTTDTCNLPIEEGSCAGNFSRWGFNSKSRTCEQFTWGGCEGNSNRFNSEAACEMRCNPPGVPKPECSEPQKAGNCTDKEALWSFSQSENRCLPFYYSGCGGNNNKFRSRETCEQSCPSAYVPEMCTLPADVGTCSQYRTNWFYDTAIKRCRTFYYGGCGGNGNNFATQAACENACTVFESTTTTVTPQTRPAPQPEPETYNYTAYCLLEIDKGVRCPNREETTRYAYDKSVGTCVRFNYLGCGGTQNNFPTESHCIYYCHSAQDICQLPMLSGPCNGSVMSWFYDPYSGSCSQFTYGGCKGNANRFNTREDCERRCTSETPVEATTLTTTTPSTTIAITKAPTPVPNISPECRVSPALEECRSAGTVWHFDSEHHICVGYINKARGTNCRYTGTFQSQEACERQCGAFRGIDTCMMQPEPGDCNYRFEQWYYNATSAQCNLFIYTGCGGNDNRFDSRNDCEARCNPTTVTTTTTRTTVVPTDTREECRTPSSLAPCGRNETTFYYDSNSKRCLAGEFGLCGYSNSYISEEECERRCGAFRDINVCQARLDPGSCRTGVLKFYFDSTTGRCHPFTYGGCDGGPNRFSTVEECEEVCEDYGPGGNEVSCDAYKQECASLVCPYDVIRSPTTDGCERCTCGDLETYCQQYTQECDALVCSYGIKKIQENECERCVCHDDPCSTANCTAKEHCVATLYTDPITNEKNYTAICEPDQDINAIPDCSRSSAECASLQCEFGIQRYFGSDGCARCECVSVQIDCAPLEDECKKIKCTYGVEKITGKDGCIRCKCLEHPCALVRCSETERCFPLSYKDPLTQEQKYSAECRTVSKPGFCPVDDSTSKDLQCREECKDDADCRGIAKCCKRGCAKQCLPPAPPTTQAPKIIITAAPPNIPSAPVAMPQEEPQVAATEGGKAALRCLFQSNPPPKITWRRGELTIDGSVGRYRLLSDGTLEIVSLYRNDTGVYICVADNGLGIATQEVNLVVNDPVESPVGIAGEENAVVTGVLNKPLALSCMAYGYPTPDVQWEHDGSMVAFNDAIYEARGNNLLIRRLTIQTLGQYTCQAYNGIGKAASWIVSVRAYRPEGFIIEHEYLVPRYSVQLYATTRAPPLLTTRRYLPTSTTTTTTTTERQILFTMPVSAHVKTTTGTLSTGADLHLECELDGFPEPTVHWTKDGVLIQPDSRISITGNSIISRLVVSRVTEGDSGLYGCNANNGYSSQSDNAKINVQQIIVPAKCTDNPYFAKCELIVRSNYCHHQYYSKFCCKSCVQAGQLDPEWAEQQADQPYRRK